ncbi:hypothetical protein DAPPUDRAFT_260227 [Daphnia pulex]|uniref:Uncharacterized protein n=1 Tax=Daphnia pulex TaxID=6669 RepID=E9HIR6_DAPPU|nr:hypothetical protein DAPPUDRAFT_260227 [Daphnia pulex]|eukprot:EFX68368.1 hypothetical protein DAPPUDRAFT_260227 [Daphnia pulex]
MNISVCFLEKHAVSLWNRVGPGTEILEPMLAFVHDQRSAPSLSSRRTLIQLIASSLRTQKSTCLTSLTSWNTSVVASVPLLHPCSHSLRDYAQVPDN